MNTCSKCSSAMVRAGSYDPDGVISLHGGKKEYDKNGNLEEWWICINQECEEGKKNIR